MNYIFDLGGVVLDWTFANVIDNTLNDERKTKIIIESIFYNDYWKKWDQGLVTIDEVAQNGVEITNLNFSEIKSVLEKVPLSFSPNQQMIKLLDKLKQKPKTKLFVLSNMPPQSVSYFEKEFSFLKLFDGIVFSCKVNMVKPNIDIYKYLVDNFDINPEQSIFIDDRKENLVPAQKLGMKTILFLDYQNFITDLENNSFF